MKAILEYQKEYFRDGDESHLKPMVLKDIAEKTGFDISTISRVVNSKYIETPFGIYSLKYFFSEGLENQDGEEVSTREIKKALQECVDSEDKRRPLTDDQLVDEMNKRGYKVARRTIAKYRDQLNIPKARLPADSVAANLLRVKCLVVKHRKNPRDRQEAPVKMADSRRISQGRPGWQMLQKTARTRFSPLIPTLTFS